MARRRKKPRFDRFPEPEIDDKKVLQDTRNMEYMSKFRDWHVRTVFYYALLGMTDEQIAQAFDISLSTLSMWKRKHQTFLDALKEGKQQADAQVVHSLYQLALGYEHPSEQLFMGKERYFDPQTGKLIKEEPKIVRAPITKKYPPNAKAAIKWLETRQAEHWKTVDRREVGLQVNVKHGIDLSELNADELRVLHKLSGAGERHRTEGQGFVTTEQVERGRVEDVEPLKDDETDVEDKKAG